MVCCEKAVMVQGKTSIHRDVVIHYVWNIHRGDAIGDTWGEFTAETDILKNQTTVAKMRAEANKLRGVNAAAKGLHGRRGNSGANAEKVRLHKVVTLRVAKVLDLFVALDVITAASSGSRTPRLGEQSTT